MTVGECINLADAVRPNSISLATKTELLNTLEQDLKEGLFDMYNSQICINPYSEANINVQLNLAETHMYITYLVSQYDNILADFDRYNNSATMFNTYLDNFKRKFTRNSKPNGCKVGGV